MMTELLKRKVDIPVVIVGENDNKKALNVPVECHH